jgi:Base plate wedge protein 53
MPIVNYPTSSPYAVTPQFPWRLGRYVHRAIPPSPGDEPKTLSTKYHNRPDNLAFDLYGNQSYWWVFMLRNMNLIRDPIFDMVGGMTIIVPTKATLEALREN